MPSACSPPLEETRALSRRYRSRRSGEKLIDALLARPEFAEFWAQKWSDLLRNEEKALDKKGVAVFYRWIAAQLAADRPLNEFARDILAATRQHLRQPAGELLAGRPRPASARRGGRAGLPGHSRRHAARFQGNSEQGQPGPGPDVEGGRETTMVKNVI